MRQPRDGQERSREGLESRGEGAWDLDLAVKSLKNMRIGLTDASRRHLALECQRSRPSLWSALAFRLEGIRPIRLPVAAGAIALFLALGVAFLGIERQSQMNTAPYDNHPVRLVKVLPDPSGGVTLVWKDGPQRTYKVLKSTDPRNFKGAETYAVHGNRWTDDSPSRGQVTYYKVE